MSEVSSPFGSQERPKLGHGAFADTGEWPIYYWQVWDFGARVNCSPVTPDEVLLSNAANLLKPPAGFAKIRTNAAEIVWNSIAIEPARLAANCLARDGIAYRESCEADPSLRAPIVEAFFELFSDKAEFYCNFSPSVGAQAGTGFSPLTYATFNLVFGVVDRMGSASGGTLVGVLSIEDED